MATETGTATDYRDLLQKLKLFLTGESVSPIGSNGLNWEVVEERSALTSPQTNIPQGDADELVRVTNQNDQDHDQMIFKSTGGTSPETPCYFGIQTMGLSTTGYYNWQIRGLTGFSQNSPITDYVNLQDQPGRSPPAYLLLQNTTMTYWFMADNRHVKGCIKTGSSYQPFYFGFLNTFATVDEYPYPMLIAATHYEEEQIFSSNAIDVTSFLHSSGNGTTTLAVQGDVWPLMLSNGWVRFTDGNWYGLKHFSTTGGNESRFLSGAGCAFAWPLGAHQNTVAAATNQIEDNDNIHTDHTSIIPGGTPEQQQLRTFGSPQTTLLWPITIYLPNASQILGEMDGCYWAPGAGGLTSEDTLTDTGESPEIVNIVFQSVARTDAWMYLAIRNE